MESEAELARMRRDNQKYHEVLELMSKVHVQPLAQEKKNYHHNLPFAENPRFCGREDILSRIKSALSPKNKGLQTFALHGMGGVGKTQIALKYSNDSRTTYDATFWVSAENQITIGQSFREISRCLALTEPDSEVDDNTVMLEVKKWLSESGKLRKDISYTYG